MGLLWEFIWGHVLGDDGLCRDCIGTTMKTSYYHYYYIMISILIVLTLPFLLLFLLLLLLLFSWRTFAAGFGFFFRRRLPSSFAPAHSSTFSDHGCKAANALASRVLGI